MTEVATVRLTTAQALVGWLVAQRSELLDGSVVPLFAGVFGIFGHGNVLGLGTALHAVRDQLPTWRETLGSRSGPSTMSAMAAVSSISENPTSSMRHQVLVFGGALISDSRAAVPVSESASFFCLRCFTFSSDSPSLMACLKPLTAAPRSVPMVRRRLVPNITRAMAKMTSSIFESNMSFLRSEVPK